MIKTSVYSLLLFASLNVYSQNVYSQKIIVGAQDYNIQRYTLWLAGEKCTDINNYQSKYAYRSTIEMLLLCKALNLGGLEANISMVDLPNSHTLFETRRGTITIPSDSVWLSKINTDDYFVSAPIYQANEFQKGFYVLPQARDKIEQTLKDDEKKGMSVNQSLMQYSAVSSSGWSNDWSMLKKLKLSLIDTPFTKNMCSIIASQHIDFYLGDLMMKGKDEISIDCNGIELFPIRGIKIIFPESRHFVVSRRYPNSEKIFNALELGLKKLKDSGEFNRAMFPFPANKKIISQWKNIAK